MPSKTSLIAAARRTKECVWLREFLAELIGTFVLLVTGNGCIASSLLAGQVPSSFAVCFCFGLGAMIASIAVGHISGAHINPAVTVGQAFAGLFPWAKVPLYMAGQYIGSILATVVIYFVYYDALLAFNPSSNPQLNAASIFATFPGPGLTVRGALFDQVIGTGLLLFAVSAVGNSKGVQIPRYMQPMFLCFLITGLCMTFGLNCGAIFNPARDVAPRIIFALLTSHWNVFDPLEGHYWYVAGLIGPHIGALIGILLFMFCCDYETPASCPIIDCSKTNSTSKTPESHVCQLRNEEPGYSNC